jgi:hypothetical protein
MTMVYTWELTGMKLQSESGIANAVVQTYWKCSGHSNQLPEFVGTFSGATPFDLNSIDPDNFTPYDQLTEAQVLGWIKSATASYMDHINEQIEKQIKEQIAPETEVNEGDFPWSPPADTAADEPVEEEVSE